MNENISAYLVKDKLKKFKFVNDYINKNKNVRNVVYMVPKKYYNDVKKNVKVDHIICYEDLNKTNEPYEVTTEDSLLIIDCSARYKSITSCVFKRLERLALIPKKKLMVDIVPFTKSVEYAYIPFSHLERQILGHQHWYAFRENNQEYNSKGEIVEGHNFELLAEKMAPYTRIEYDHFMEHETKTLTCELTKEEHKEYDKYKVELFEKYSSIQPILTRLADYVNTTKGRYDHLKKLVSVLDGKTVVYTNIKSHNKKIETLFKHYDNVNVRTFYDNNNLESEADNIVLAEIPIVRNYLFLDVIANVKKNAKFYFITGTSTIDELLYKRMVEEFTQIDEFTKILSKKVKGCQKK